MEPHRVCAFGVYLWVLLLFLDVSITGLVMRKPIFAPRIQPGTMKSTRFLTVFRLSLFFFFPMFSQKRLQTSIVIPYIKKNLFLCLIHALMFGTFFFKFYTSLTLCANFLDFFGTLFSFFLGYPLFTIGSWNAIKLWR